MLVLTRVVNESIVIGDDIKVTILSIKNNQIRIGIEAPKNVSVHREEIYQKINAGFSEDISVNEDEYNK